MHPQLSKGEAKDNWPTPLLEEKSSPTPSPELCFTLGSQQKSCPRMLRAGQQQLYNCLGCSCITSVLRLDELLTVSLKKQQPRGRVVSPLPSTRPKEKAVEREGGFVLFRLLQSQGGSAGCAGRTAELCSQPLLAGQQ